MAESQKKSDWFTCLGCGGFSLTLTAILIADVARDIANPNSQPTEIPIPSIITNFEATDYLWVLSIPIWEKYMEILKSYLHRQGLIDNGNAPDEVINIFNNDI